MKLVIQVFAGVLLAIVVAWAGCSLYVKQTVRSFGEEMSRAQQSRAANERRLKDQPWYMSKVIGKMEDGWRWVDHGRFTCKVFPWDAEGKFFPAKIRNNGDGFNSATVHCFAYQGFDNVGEFEVRLGPLKTGDVVELNIKPTGVYQCDDISIYQIVPNE